MITKKFITTTPRQDVIPVNPGSATPYDAVENEKLNYKDSYTFPIMNVMNGYLQPEDQVELLIITTQAEKCYENYQYIVEEATKICEQIGVADLKIIRIENPLNEFSGNHLDIFQKIVEHIHDNDRLYACVTYGSKIIPLIQMMALNYGYRSCKNVCVECIVYGEYDYATKRKRIYDVTDLFLMDQIVNELGKHGNRNTFSIIQELLKDD